MDAPTEAIIAALEARLAALDEQIDRLIRTAPTLPDDKQQQDCWDRARDLQREARSVREQIHLTRERMQSMTNQVTAQSTPCPKEVTPKPRAFTTGARNLPANDRRTRSSFAPAEKRLRSG